MPRLYSQSKGLLMIITTDDVHPSNLKYFENWDKIKELIPDLKIIAFVNANYNYKEDVRESKVFNEWYEYLKDQADIVDNREMFNL